MKIRPKEFDRSHDNAIHNDWRPGQIAFNVVWIANPDWADEIRGNQNINPYLDDKNLDNFWNYLVRKREKEPHPSIRGMT